MSTTIDQRVVEMRFDNRHFESNVRNSMSTLDKLKQKLNLSGASKGLENINTSAKNVNMSGLGNAVETVSTKFSALQVIGVTALANLTNSAVNAGKRIVSALTIDPVMSGFSEYETKMGSIQTILANTQHEGTTLDDVTAALDELNTYADKTIYNFQEMTRNIGTFTAAGVDLNTSVQSIKGIANLAAVSGSTSQQASTAMYQLSQALAAGKVSLMDWNSVVNAGMGGKVFQDALVRTSELLKTGAKDAIDTYGSFRESLTKGEWLTTEVLTETLKQLSGAYSEADLIAQGFTESQAKEIAQLAQTASDAATKVKTFTQLFDTLKESAQSGWAQTWELIFGDFEEAKSFFTELSDGIGGLINSMSDWRNNMLGEALNSNYDKLINKINTAGIKTNEFEEKLRKVFNNDEKFDKIIEDCGSLERAIKQGAISSDILKQALAELGIGAAGSTEKIAGFVEGLKTIKRQLGWGAVGDDVKNLQIALEELGYTVGKCGIDGIIGPDTTNAIKEFQKAAGLAVDGIAGPETIAALEKAGVKMTEISGETKNAAESYDELIDNITKKGGRELFLDGFKNTIGSIVDLLKLVGRAFANIFPADNAATKIYNMAKSFSEFAKSLRLFTEVTNEAGEKMLVPTETGDKLLRTFKGLFAIIDIVTTILGGPLKWGLEIVSDILGSFGLSFLDVTAGVGDAIVGFRDFIDEIYDFGNIIHKVLPYIQDFLDGLGKIAEKIRRVFSDLPNMDSFSNLVDKFNAAGEAFREFVDALKSGESIGSDVVAGLVKGLLGGIGDVLIAAGKLVVDLIKAICSPLGIESPSTVMIAIGGFIIAGLIVGLQNGFGELWNTLGDIAKNLINWAKGLDFGTVFAIAIGVGMTALIAKIATIITNFSSPLKGLGDALEGLGDMFKGIGASFKAKKWESIGNAIKSFAIAIGILAASVYVLAQLDTADLWIAIGAIAALAVIVGVLSAAIGKFGPTQPLKLAGLSFALLGLSAAILIISNAVKNLGALDPEQAKQGFLGLAGVIGAIAIVFGAYGLLVKGKSAQNIDKLGGMLLKLSITLLLMIGVVKLASKLNNSELINASKFIGGFLAFALGVQLIGLIPGKKIDKLGGTLLKMSMAMLLMIGVVKLSSKITDGELIAAGKFAGGFLVFMLGMQLIGLIPGNNLSKLGGSLLKMSIAMLLMIGVVKLANKLSDDELINAAKFVGGFLVFVLALRLIGLIPGGDMSKLGTTLLAMAVAIGILAGVVALMGMLKPEQLTKGLIAVGVLGTIMTLMIWASRGATKCVGNLVVMTVAIGVMATAIAALSMIDGSKLWSATLAISLVMGIFALVLKSGNNITSSIGPLIVMTVAIGLIGGVIYLLSGLPVESVIGTAISLSVLLLSMAGVLAILSVIKLSATEALIGIVALTALAIPMLAFVGVLALMSNVENATANANALTKMMATMSLLLIPLTIVGFLWPAAAAGLIALTAMAIPMLAFVGVMALMSEIGIATENVNLLTSMMVTMTGLLTQLALIGPMALIGVAAMAGLSLLIVGIGLFAVGIGALMEKFPALQEFLNTGIPILEQLAGAIGRMIGKFIDGVLTEATVNLGTVADNLSSFISKLQPFIDGVSTIDPNFKTNVTTLIDTISSLIKAEIFGTISSWLPGSDDTLANFATQLKTLGKGLSDYMKETEGVSAESIAQSVSAAKKLIELGNMVPEDGIFGTDGIDDFGKNAVSFAKSLKKYSEKAAEIDTEAISKSVTAARSLMNVAKLVPDDGTFGTDGIDDFGKNIVSFGKSIKNYSEKVADVDSSAITGSANAVKRVAGVINSLTSLDTSGVGPFKSAISTLSKTNISGFVETFKGASSKLTSVGSNMIESIIKGMKSKTSQFKAVANTIVNSVSQGIKSKNGAYNAAGVGLANALVKGISSRRNAVKSALVATISTAVARIRSYYSSFYSAGSYLVSGFAAGITANTWRAAAKAAAMANAAEKAARDALDINSPSKVFRALGYSVPEGFAMGIDKLSGMVTASSVGMTDNALHTVKDSISKIATLVSGDMDVAPTIRPVLDLSNVRAGANSISGMLGLGSSIGVMANVGAVSSMMNRYSQNGAENEVVIAINKLRKDLANVDRASYNINGVTYDDGSNIAAAVEAIVRKARIERRV